MNSFESPFELTKAWAIQQDLQLFTEPSIASTNTWALNQAVKSELSPALFLADEQFEGRGRFDRKWLSTGAGNGLFSSWVFFQSRPPQPILTPLLGETLFASASTTWPGLNWSLKAPNDLYLEQLKIAGLLVENQIWGSQTKIVIGLGFNVLASPQLVTESPRLGATHLLQKTNHYDALTWHSFLSQLFVGFEQCLGESQKQKLSETKRLKILKALQQHPVLEKRVTGLTASGDLEVDDHLISWMDL